MILQFKTDKKLKNAPALNCIIGLLRINSKEREFACFITVKYYRQYSLNAIYRESEKQKRTLGCVSVFEISYTIYQIYLAANRN